jgi:hypothetical protein
MVLQAYLKSRTEIETIILEEYPWGVYVMVFRFGDNIPFCDSLQDSWEHAREEAFEDYGASDDDFFEIPDTKLME